MRWREAINLRSSRKQQETLWAALSGLLSVEDHTGALVRMEIYRDAMVDTDMSIHVCRESRNAKKDGSPLGLQLGEAFTPFGLVHHSVWLERGISTSGNVDLYGLEGPLAEEKEVT
jgi:hypothetical protein